ncbi:MAG TPA: magnesium/cobalt transporter CorA [Kofleriaceae bacterium]|jgi:magnesium transporter|nr:magnesium/cobalt transporter CorA [Kofleriaceae bacterium]
MRAFIYADGTIRETRSVEDVRAARAAHQLQWIDLEAETPETQALLAELGLHPLTIDDIWSERVTPKVEEFTDYLYVLVHSVVRETGQTAIQLRELDVVIGADYVVTHDQSGETSKQLREDLQQSPKLLARGAVWLGYALIDRLVDAYLPAIDCFDEEIETIEDDVLAKAGTPDGQLVLARILGLKRALQALRRVAVHQREVLLRLARGEFDTIPEEALPYFRNVHDHFVRVGDLADSYRDLVTSALEAYLSVQSNRMNQVMKQLALISTVLLPITFVASVYGMNIDDLPLQHSRWGFDVVIGGMVVVAIGSFLWFRYKRWLD